MTWYRVLADSAMCRLHAHALPSTLGGSFCGCGQGRALGLQRLAQGGRGGEGRGGGGGQTKQGALPANHLQACILAPHMLAAPQLCRWGGGWGESARAVFEHYSTTALQSSTTVRCGCTVVLTGVE